MRPRAFAFALAGAVLATAACGGPSDPTRAPVAPTRGWDSWNAYGCTVTQTQVERQADALVSAGLAAAGYRTVIIDDCWFDPSRGPDGRLRANSKTFPGGMAALGEYLHARGLRFGLYESPGAQTCAQFTGAYPGRTGSLDHEALDAQTFADWGVDYLKYDWCAPDASRPSQLAAFRTMRDALARTGRPITYAINPNSGFARSVPGASGSWAGIADAVRVTNDVVPAWHLGTPPTQNQGIDDVLRAVPPEPGTVRDLDMLAAGLPGVSDDEARTQIAKWAELRSPLILSSDITALAPDRLTLLRGATSPRRR